MQWIASVNNPAPLRLVIKHDTRVGYYLYIYEGKNTRCTYDYLQDTLDIAKSFAVKNFQVPLDAWQQVD